MRRTLLGGTSVAMVALVAGCNLFVPLAFVIQHKKTFSPEFDKLPGRRVVVLVWTDPSTLFDYPHARFELAANVADKLATEMATRELKVDVVDARDLEDFLQRDPDARIDPERVGRHFEVDYVIYLEVSRFQFREIDQPQFLRGRIDASVSVHDCREDPEDLPYYELAPVKSVYPEGGPVAMTATNSLALRQTTYLLFAELVARKFYEYTLDM